MSPFFEGAKTRESQAHRYELAQQKGSPNYREENAAVRFLAGQTKKFTVAFLVALMLSVMIAPSFAQSSISFDANVLIAQVNIWVPIFLPILAIGIAISIAIALVEKVGSSILNAFKK